MSRGLEIMLTRRKLFGNPERVSASVVINFELQLGYGNLAMTKQNVWFGEAEYQIEVGGTLGSLHSEWLDGMTMRSEGAMTIINGNVPDQPALHGILARIRDLGMPLISVKRIKPEQNG